jgi:hypothetical protein
MFGTVSTCSLFRSTLCANQDNPAEIFGSPTTDSIKNPLTAAYLRIDSGPPVSPPVYAFDEAGIVIEGMSLRVKY